MSQMMCRRFLPLTFTFLFCLLNFQRHASFSLAYPSRELSLEKNLLLSINISGSCYTPRMLPIPDHRHELVHQLEPYYYRIPQDSVTLCMMWFEKCQLAVEFIPIKYLKEENPTALEGFLPYDIFATIGKAQDDESLTYSKFSSTANMNSIGIPDFGNARIVFAFSKRYNTFDFKFTSHFFNPSQAHIDIKPRTNNYEGRVTIAVARDVNNNDFVRTRTWDGVSILRFPCSYVDEKKDSDIQQITQYTPPPENAKFAQISVYGIGGWKTNENKKIDIPFAVDSNKSTCTAILINISSAGSHQVTATKLEYQSCWTSLFLNHKEGEEFLLGVIAKGYRQESLVWSIHHTDNEVSGGQLPHTPVMVFVYAGVDFERLPIEDDSTANAAGRYDDHKTTHPRRRRICLHKKTSCTLLPFSTPSGICFHFHKLKPYKKEEKIEFPTDKFKKKHQIPEALFPKKYETLSTGRLYDSNESINVNRMTGRLYDSNESINVNRMTGRLYENKMERQNESTSRGTERQNESTSRGTRSKRRTSQTPILNTIKEEKNNSKKLKTTIKERSKV